MAETNEGESKSFNVHSRKKKKTHSFLSKFTSTSSPLWMNKSILKLKVTINFDAVKNKSPRQFV